MIMEASSASHVSMFIHEFALVTLNRQPPPTPFNQVMIIPRSPRFAIDIAARMPNNQPSNQQEPNLTSIIK
jgi:hypothetical protein